MKFTRLVNSIKYEIFYQQLLKIIIFTSRFQHFCYIFLLCNSY